MNTLTQQYRNTPWGPAQTVKVLAPGITDISTAGHGGIHLSDEREQAMHPALRAARRWAGGNWFEEDCDWALVAMAFPEAFEESARLAAIETVRNNHPNAWEGFMGTKLKPGESYTRDEATFYFEHRHDWLGVCAHGGPSTSKPNVTEGFVGVEAMQGGRSKSGTLKSWEQAPRRYFLVHSEEYQERGRFAFVCRVGDHIETDSNFVPIRTEVHP